MYSISSPIESGSRVAPGDDGHRHVGDPADAVEGAVRIVGQLAVQSGAGRLGHVVEQERVAVGLGAGRAGGAHGAAGAAGVLDQQLLAEGAGHRFGDQPCHRIGRPAGGVRDEHGDRVGRVVGLGARRVLASRTDASKEVNRCMDLTPWYGGG